MISLMFFLSTMFTYLLSTKPDPNKPYGFFSVVFTYCRPSPTQISFMVSLASCFLTCYPPNFSTRSSRGLPHPSSDLCYNCLRHWKDAPSLSPHKVCPPTRSAPSERLGYWWGCGSNIAPKHARKHGTRPSRIKELVPSRFKRFWFYLCWRKQCRRL